MDDRVTHGVRAETPHGLTEAAAADAITLVYEERRAVASVRADLCLFTAVSTEGVEHGDGRIELTRIWVQGAAAVTTDDGCPRARHSCLVVCEGRIGESNVP